MVRRNLFALLVAVLGIAIAMPASDSFAQQQQRRGLLEMLFGPRILQPRPPGQLQPFGQPVPRKQRSAPSEPAVPTVEAVAKAPDAKKVLVLGDFVAGGLAWGLEQTFAEQPNLLVVDRSNNASGLVRDDYYDWNAELLKILNEEKPDFVVVALGSNDRQQIRTDAGRLALRSEPWEKAYVARIAGMADTLKIYGRPFFWMGAPPMRQSSAMRDMAYFNDLYRPAVTNAGGVFVDIWGGFTNEEGRYISSGPDVAGQLRGLRSGDGINFTRAGRLKLAFFVDREIKRVTGAGGTGVDLMASAAQQSQIEIGPDGQKRLVGPVISLSDPLPGGSAALAGGPDEPEIKEGETPQYLLIVKGSALPIVTGRADDFTWPRGRRPPVAVAPATVDPAAAAAAN